MDFTKPCNDLCTPNDSVKYRINENTVIVLVDTWADFHIDYFIHGLSYLNI